MADHTEVTLTLRVPGILDDEERTLLKQIITQATLDFSDSGSVMVMKLPREKTKGDKEAVKTLTDAQRMLMAQALAEVVRGFYVTGRVMTKALPETWDDADAAAFCTAVDRLYEEAIR